MTDSLKWRHRDDKWVTSHTKFFYPCVNARRHQGDAERSKKRREKDIFESRIDKNFSSNVETSYFMTSDEDKKFEMKFQK